MRKLLVSVITLLLAAPLFVGCDRIKNINSPVKVKWRYETGFSLSENLEEYRLVVAGNVVYAGNQKDYLYALDKETGKPIWKFYKENMTFTSPSVVDGVVYVGIWSVNDEVGKFLCAIDAASGEQKWRTRLGNTSGAFGLLKVVDGVIYVGSKDEHLYAVNAENGELKWDFKTKDSIVTTPSVADGVVYIGSGYSLYVIDAKTGELKRRCLLGDSKVYSPTVIDGIVYVGNMHLYLYAMDAYGCDEKWRSKEGYGMISSPTVINGVVYAAGSWGTYLNAFTAESGRLKWRFKTNGTIYSSPSVVDRVVYVGSWDHYLYALDSNSGVLKWKFYIGDSAITSIVLVDDHIFFGSRRGYIYALELKK